MIFHAILLGILLCAGHAIHTDRADKLKQPRTFSRYITSYDDDDDDGIKHTYNVYIPYSTTHNIVVTAAAAVHHYNRYIVYYRTRRDYSRRAYPLQSPTRRVERPWKRARSLDQLANSCVCALLAKNGGGEGEKENHRRRKYIMYIIRSRIYNIILCEYYYILLYINDLHIEDMRISAAASTVARSTSRPLIAQRGIYALVYYVCICI